MKILAVDTALGACSVAVIEGERVLAHRYVPMERGHAEALAPMVQDVMREAALEFAQLDRLAVTTGPGTFTGQRVGIAFMRGLRVALNKPLIGITTLEAMCAAALAESGERVAAAIHDAKRGEAYLGISSSSDVLLPPTLAALDEVPLQIKKHASGSIALAGTAAETIAAQLGTPARLTSVRQPDALWVARLAMRASKPAAPPQPLYLRAPDAKLPASA
jgi:tRNA threonylcarbamoyl adenosine modification protein YeaZ